MRVIIILGAGTKKDGPSVVLKSRLDEAIAYYREVSAQEETIIIVSGGFGNKNYSEAQVMLEYLLKNGIPRGAILEENQSVSTKENMELSKKLLADNGIPADTVVVVTSEFHLKRSLYHAKDNFGVVYGIGSYSDQDYLYNEKEAKIRARLGL